MWPNTSDRPSRSRSRSQTRSNAVKLPRSSPAYTPKPAQRRRHRSPAHRRHLRHRHHRGGANLYVALWIVHGESLAERPSLHPPSPSSTRCASAASSQLRYRPLTAAASSTATSRKHLPVTATGTTVKPSTGTERGKCSTTVSCRAGPKQTRRDHDGEPHRRNGEAGSGTVDRTAIRATL